MKNHKIESFEQMILMSASGADTDITGTDAADMLVSDADNQALIGLDGNDTIEGGLNSLISGGAGDDRIITQDGINVVDGGSGTDTLQLLGSNSDDFHVIDRGFGILEVCSDTQRTFITDVELVQFDDGVFTIAQLTGGSDGVGTSGTPIIVDPANTHITIDENTTFVVDVNAIDLQGDTLTFSLADTEDSSFFTIDPVTGVLSFINAPDFENPLDAGADNTYDVTIIVSDGTNQSEITLWVTVDDVDEGGGGTNTPPVFTNVQEGEIVDVVENTTSVGDVDATDADGDTLTYSISGGADSSLFTIDSATGVVSFIAAPDFEAPGDADGNNLYLLQLTVSDGNGGTEVRNVTIRVTDANEGGTGNNAPVFTNVQEGEEVVVSENTTLVGDADASDADGDTLTYSITGGADSSLFSINSSTGVVSFLAAPDFENPGDANGNNIYELQLTVADGNGGTDVKNVTVRVSDVTEGGANNAPVFTNVQEGEVVDVAENTTSVGDADASDADGDTLTYSITGGADSSLFSINSSTGVVSFLAAPDHEAPGDADGNNLYQIQLTVADGNGGTDVRNVTIRVTDVTEGGSNTAPVFTNVQEGEQVIVSENTTLVGDADASDADGDTLTYSISGGADSSLFSINSSTGVVSFLAAPDFENPGDANGNNIYELQLTVADGNGGTDVKNVTVRVSDVTEGGANNAPVFTNVQEGEVVDVAENTTSVGDADASDADGDTLTYSITGGADSSLFSINSSTGVVSFLAAPDHEAPGDADGNNLYQIQLTVADGNGGTDVRNVTIRVTDVTEGGSNTAPVFTNVQEGEEVVVSENTTLVGDADASDADGDTLTYTITGGADSSLFSINSSTGVVSFLAAPDFENPGDANGNNIYELQLTVADGNGGTDVKNVTVRVSDVTEGGANNAPVFTNVQEGEVVDVAENTTSVGDADASDADGDTLTYSITGGADSSLFSINSSTGVVSFLAAPDHEAPGDADGNNLYQIQLTVADGNGGTDVRNVTIRVTDVTEGGSNTAPVFTNVQEGEQVIVSENTTLVGDADASDADGDTLTYSISGGADSSLFSINSSTGVVSFLAAPDFENPGDANGNNIYELQLTVADGNGGTDVKNVTVRVSDVTEGGANNAPVFTNVQEGEQVTVSENTTSVGDADASDADGDTLTYSISGGADSSLFSINSATGVVSFIAAPDFEAPGDANGNNIYELQLTVADGNGGTDVKNVTVRVSDVGNEGGTNTAPVFTNVQEGEVVNVAENTTLVGDADASDANGDTLTYSISGGADSSLFSINSATGVVSFLAAPDFEAPGDADGNNLYQIQLTVADGNGGTDVKNVTVRVTDVGNNPGNQAPFFTNIFQNESVAIAEGTTFVGDADAFDANGDTLTYSISGGVDSSLFTINSSTGQLSFINAQDFENPGDSNGDNFFELTLRVSDGSSFQERNIFVQIDDVTEGGNQAPRFTNVQVSEFVNVNENTTLVGDADAADADGDSLAFSIVGGSDASLFTINSTTGVLSFINGQDFENPGDADGDNSFGVVIRVSDGTSYQDRLIWVELVNTAS